MTYARHGYALYRGCIPAALIEAVRNTAYSDPVRSGPVRFRYDRHHVVNVHREHAAVGEVLQHLPVADIFGDGVFAITHSKFSFRYPGVDYKWHPHQDSAYKPGPRKGAVFVVAIDECDQGNGTIELAPGSHHLGPCSHHAVGGQQLEIDTDAYATIALKLERGDVVAMHLDTVHKSGRNTSGDNLRCLLFIEVEPWTLEPTLLDDTGEPALIRSWRKA